METIEERQEYYQQSVYRFNNYYLEIAENSSDPWPEIEKDEPNIRNAADWVADQLNVAAGLVPAYKESQDLLIQLAYGYAFALSGYIYRRSIHEGLRWLEAGVVACKESGKKRDEAILYNTIGLRYTAQGNYPEALRWSEKSIGIFKEVGSWHPVALLLSNIGLLYRETGKKDKAKQYLQQSYQLFLQLNLNSEADEVRRLLDSL